MAEKRSLIDVVLELDRKSLNYRVEFRPEEARELATRMPDYNNATAQNLVILFERLDDLIPKMRFPKINGMENVNNGKPHHKYLIGREGSRVVYLEIVKSYFPEPFDYDRLFEGVRTFGKLAEADEIDIRDEEESVEVRLWWD